MDKWDIRYTNLSDQKFLRKWLDDSEDLKWFAFTKKEEVDVAVRNWMYYSKYQCSITAVIDNEPVGIATLFLMPYRKICHKAMFYLIVNKKNRGMGIGFSLLKNVCHLAKTYFKLEGLYIELYEGCPLIALLEKQGFQKLFEQNHYVMIDGEKKKRLVFEKDLRE
ncbi:MAG TPA: GNAT family N-acetyltransferase [Chlamydiales bacterium]|nr:GNAT family N-acetyltransferase [Chlamydiales bacterium]